MEEKEKLRKNIRKIINNNDYTSSVELEALEHPSRQQYNALESIIEPDPKASPIDTKKETKKKTQENKQQNKSSDEFGLITRQNQDLIKAIIPMDTTSSNDRLVSHNVQLGTRTSKLYSKNS